VRTFPVFPLIVALSVTLAPQSSQTGREPTLKPGQISFAITADSMSPTLVSGDRITLDVLYYRSHVPRSGELVVLRVPTDQPMPERVVSVQPLQVKRVVAVGGDVISLSGKRLRVNGIDAPESYAHYEPVGSVVESGDFESVKIPANHFFVLGDNRSHSLDSRHFGAITLNAIVGKPLYIYDSPDKSRIGRGIR
jgi:signal peptidase I